MCQLYALRASEPTKVECSLVRAQNELMSQRRRDHRHVNGWGVVCYDQRDGFSRPTTVRHSNGAFGSDCFSRTAEKVYSKTVVAHVRCATIGFTSTLNAHPFIHDAWTFAHHGTISGFDVIGNKMAASIGERYLNCRLGTTDSELFFLWLLHHLETGNVTSDNVVEQQATARKLLVDAIASLAHDCSQVAPQESLKLNFILTNGRVLFACRWNNSLHIAVRDGIYDCEICGIPHIRHDEAVSYRAVVVASEPITGESWQELSNHSLLFVGPEMNCHVDKIPNETLTCN